MDWIISYLLNRTEQICVHNLLSDTMTLNYNIPQGSILGPDFYSDFTEPVGDIVRKSVVLPLFYADDSQLYVHFKATCQTMHLPINKIESCRDNVISWRSSNLLKLNQEKTEVVIFGSKLRLTKLDIECIRIGDSYIKPCNIGVQLDCNMNMRCQVNKFLCPGFI